MSNWVIAPLFIPLITAIVLVFFSKRVLIQRWISGGSVLVNVAASVYLVKEVAAKGILTLHMSGWVPPFGIVFVADLFAALLVLTTSVIGAACVFFAFSSIGEAKEKHYFYAFVQFLLVGVIGSFLTGDIFNLFVCFEVMLISSYALIVLGGSKLQLRESLKYILVNMIGSTLFVASVAYLYAVTGTLNMAQLSVRIASMEAGGILAVIAIMFLIVFALKAGLVLFYWLPGSYSAPPAVVIALFGGLLTKVGVYAIVRTFTLLFPWPPGMMQTIIGWMAAVTMVLGVLGAVAYKDVQRILIYNIVAAVGFLAFGLSVANQAALEGLVFYLIHDMIAKTLLFLLGGMLILVAGTSKLKEMGGLIGRYPLLGWMFLIAGLAIVGIPPLSGFVGKLLIVQGGLEGGHYVLTGIALLSSLLILYSMLKIFIGAFWGRERGEDDGALSDVGATIAIPSFMLASSIVLFVLVILIGVGAEWVYGYVLPASKVLLDPQIYIDAVLNAPHGRL